MPILQAARNKFLPDVPFFNCAVGNREEWKGHPDHPYKVHPVWRVERVPTLIDIVGGREVGRLVETECASTKGVEEFMTRTIPSL